jgi:Transmembrane protein 43
VHGRGDELSAPALSDEDFRVSAPTNSFRLRREVEYCQWVEFHTDETREDTDGNKHTLRTYYYQKSWRSHPVPSLLFDQPGAHHNPLRAPFSDAEMVGLAKR